jgi:hypothetical protein
MVTLDESWFDFVIDNEEIGMPTEQDPETQERKSIGIPKTILSIARNPNRFHAVGVVSKGRKFNSDHSLSNILTPICNDLATSRIEVLTNENPGSIDP